MPTLTIRNLEDAVVDALKARARRKGRSLEAEVRKVLREAATRTAPESVRDLADRIAALTPDVGQTDSTELVRAGAERLPEANRAAWVGLPGVLIWDLERP